MKIDINNIVRSVLLTVAVLPLTLATSGAINSSTEAGREQREVTVADQIVDEHRDALTKACIDYQVSKPDSTLERDAKTTIDKFMGGEVMYGLAVGF